MEAESLNVLLLRIENLENRLAESEQLIEAIKAGEVDAFAMSTNSVPEVFTLQSGDYAYRVLIEEFGEGAVNLSEDGLIVYTNKSFFELLQLKYEDVIGRMITDYIDPKSLPIFNDLFFTARMGKSSGEIDLIIHGKIIPVYISLTSLQPKLPTVGMIITDQSEKKKHEEIVTRYRKDLELKNSQLELSNKELDSFTYIASHDLQEPLRKIQTFCQRIIESSHGVFSETTSDYFDRVINASQRMQHMIKSLLDYSRMNSSTLDKIPTDLNEILNEVIDDQTDDEPKNQITIIRETLPSIPAYPDQMKQLFSNLLSNAVKYKKTDTPLEVRIHSVKEDGFWKITFSDNGIGFEPRFADRIFELFQRLHSRYEYEGTGIGLAICKKIVQNHQGCIKGVGIPGKSASFEIYLPVHL